MSYGVPDGKSARLARPQKARFPHEKHKNQIVLMKINHKKD
jgi:hypothetical protein